VRLYAIIRRRGWRTAESLKEAAGRSARVANKQMPDQLRWIRTYALAEPGGSFGTVCLYEADSPEAVRQHAMRADLPVDEVIPVADTLVVHPDPNSERSLYERLGGKTGIARIIDDALTAHLANPVIRTRFQGIQDLDHTKKMACEFFTAVAGGPGSYRGREMATAHRGMNVSEQEYLAVVDDLMDALARNEVEETARKDVLMILYSLRGEILRR